MKKIAILACAGLLCLCAAGCQPQDTPSAPAGPEEPFAGRVVGAGCYRLSYLEADGAGIVDAVLYNEEIVLALLKKGDGVQAAAFDLESGVQAAQITPDHFAAARIEPWSDGSFSLLDEEGGCLFFGTLFYRDPLRIPAADPSLRRFVNKTTYYLLRGGILYNGTAIVETEEEMYDLSDRYEDVRLLNATEEFARLTGTDKTDGRPAELLFAKAEGTLSVLTRPEQEQTFCGAYTVRRDGTDLWYALPGAAERHCTLQSADETVLACTDALVLTDRGVYRPADGVFAAYGDPADPPVRGHILPAGSQAVAVGRSVYLLDLTRLLPAEASAPAR